MALSARARSHSLVMAMLAEADRAAEQKANAGVQSGDTAAQSRAHWHFR